MLFDNKTTNEIKRAAQVKQLLCLVDSVVASNGGQPFSDEIFVELKVRMFLTSYEKSVDVISDIYFH